MLKAKERGKWLIALALCLCSLIFCVSLMSAPTRAEETAVVWLVGEEATTTTTTTTTTESGSVTTAPGESSSAVTTTAPGESASVQGSKYVPVPGYRNVYEVLNGQGGQYTPRRYVYNPVAVPVDGASPDNQLAAYPWNDGFYATMINGSGIFLAVRADGSLNFTNAIWWGPDGVFGPNANGVNDDVATTLQEVGGYFFWRQADGSWRLIEGIFNPERTTAPDTGSSSSAPGQSSSGPDESSTTENGFLTNPELDKPKTGKDAFNPGLAACMALLLVGCAYCGYQALRRRGVKTH